jgi:hypothetical protein
VSCAGLLSRAKFVDAGNLGEIIVRATQSRAPRRVGKNLFFRQHKNRDIL